MTHSLRALRDFKLPNCDYKSIFLASEKTSLASLKFCCYSWSFLMGTWTTSQQHVLISHAVPRALVHLLNSSDIGSPKRDIQLHHFHFNGRVARWKSWEAMPDFLNPNKFMEYKIVIAMKNMETWPWTHICRTWSTVKGSYRTVLWTLVGYSSQCLMYFVCSLS